MTDTSGQRIIRTFHEALDIVDSSEGPIRLIVENSLMDVTGPNSSRALEAVKDAMDKIAAVRVKAIKDAFKHLRANLPHQEE